MNSTFLLEIGTEELPADFARLALGQLDRMVRRDLRENRLDHAAVTSTSTPRRLVVRVDALQERQEDLTEERKGPPTAQAFKDGVPGQAAIGFAKRCGVDPADLNVRETPKGPCVFATVCTPGQSSQTLLQEMIPRWIDGLQGRRFMRWGQGTQRFSRPIRWLLALQGSDLIQVDLQDGDPQVSSAQFSRGHRLHGDQPLAIQDSDSYEATLVAAGVVVNREERSRSIRSAIETESQALEGIPNCPSALFEELVDLVEDPQVLRGRIADRFLKLPPEVISTVMQAHQRYIPLDVPGVQSDPLRLEAVAVLRPEFLLVGNGLKQASELIIRGNERVLSARLADAEFFLGVDRRQSSASRRDALQRVTFADGLGSLRDRSDRIERLTDQLIQSLPVSPEVASTACKAARFCKHDLVSQMVGEFPELQGLIGGKYLLEEGEPRGVALAVVEHYLPKGAGDELPSTEAGAVVALAERLELLLSIYAKGERPSGSSDPYALRRAGNGVLRLLWDKSWRIDFVALLSDAVTVWSELFPAFNVDQQTLCGDLMLLLRQRIVSQLEEDGNAPDLVQAVAGAAISDQRLLRDPVDVQDRIKLLTKLRDQGGLAALQAVVQRAARLAEKGDLSVDNLSPSDVVDPSLFASPSENGMHAVVVMLEPLATSRAYPDLAAALVEATPVLEAFFDGDTSVMVMADDPALRRNRLNLLGVLRNQASVLARFDLIQS